MHKSKYGELTPMVGCQDAIAWVEGLKDIGPDPEYRERVLKRMEYEFAKDIPVPIKFHKGRYGKKYDSYTCGNCGHTASFEAHWRYCPNCGFAIGWKEGSE